MSTIEARNLVKKYGNFTAVNGISFNVEAGEIFGFLGPNGAGKTTTINILCALLRPTSGTVLINGVDISKETMKVRESIGLIFQDTSVDNQLTGRENLQIHGQLYAVPRDIIDKRIPEVLNLVELSEWADKLVGTYSGGMKRRLEIARGLLHQPRVLFLDEPTLGLDPQTRAHIWQYIINLHQEQGVTIFLSTHYMDEAENCTRIAIIDHGEIVAMDTPARLKALAGEDIITMDTDNNEQAIKLIEEGFDITAKQGIDGLQFEVAEGAKFIPRFISSFNEADGHPQILSISLRRPTLDDVFLKITGRAIRQESASATEQQRIFLSCEDNRGKGAITLTQIDNVIDRDIRTLATVWRREILHIWRDKPRLVASIIQPVLFFLLIGNGLAPAFGQMAGGIDFKKFMFPGIIGMTVLFSSMFYGVTVVWDREFGFLKEILAAPVRRYVVALGKILAGATISMTQALIVLMLVPFLAGVSLTLTMVLKLAPLLFLVAVLVTSMGVAVGGTIKSIQAFQVIMMVLVMPLFFISGALFPLKNLPTWMDVLSKIDPLTYGVDPIRQIGLTTTLRSHGIQAFAVHSIGFDIWMLLVFTAIMIAAAIAVFRRL